MKISSNGLGKDKLYRATSPVWKQTAGDKLHYAFFVNDIKVGVGRSQPLSTEAMAGTLTGRLFELFFQGEPGTKAKAVTFSVSDRAE